MQPDTELERRQNTHEQRTQFLTKRIDWLKTHGTTYPDRRQHGTQDIRPERKIDKKTTTGV